MPAVRDGTRSRLDLGENKKKQPTREVVSFLTVVKNSLEVLVYNSFRVSLGSFTYTCSLQYRCTPSLHLYIGVDKDISYGKTRANI